MDAKEKRNFEKLSQLDQASVEKETSGDELFESSMPYETEAGEGAEFVANREPRADAPVNERSYRRLDEKPT